MVEEKSNRGVKILEALENPNYKWRTIKGIAKEANLSREDVMESMLKNENLVISCYLNSTTGERLFTTRKHYKANTSIAIRILSGITHRIY